MTRKDWDKLSKVLKECEGANYGGPTPVAPSAEWMRRRIIHAIAHEFLLNYSETRDLFFRAAGLPYKFEQERTFR